MTDRISELEARIAERNAANEVDSAELERLKAEPDWERYRGMVGAFISNSAGALGRRLSDANKQTIRAILAARNHDPDVVALVQWARNAMVDGAQDRNRRDAFLAPFAAIKGD